MPIYIIPWKIEGTARIEASSPEEAKDKFAELTAVELAERGELESYEPETELPPGIKIVASKSP